MLFNIFETSVTSQMVENICIIVLLLIATDDCFSPTTASKAFAYNS